MCYCFPAVIEFLMNVAIWIIRKECWLFARALLANLYSSTNCLGSLKPVYHH